MATARDDADEFQLLRPFRARPAMYIGSTDAQGLEHMLLEVVSNSIDEHIAHHADQLSVSFEMRPSSWKTTGEEFLSTSCLGTGAQRSRWF